jgi:hypothetical protein
MATRSLTSKNTPPVPSPRIRTKLEHVPVRRSPHPQGAGILAAGGVGSGQQIAAAVTVIERWVQEYLEATNTLNEFQ